jgi:hypothetical protein
MNKKEEIPEISIEQIDEILEFLPIFEQEGYDFGEEPYFQKTGEKHFNFMGNIWSEEVSEFVQLLYDSNFIFSFDWPSWGNEAVKYYENPDELSRADLMILRKLMIAHVRGDRFNEGHLLAMFNEGHINAILRRLKEIREGMTK